MNRGLNTKRFDAVMQSIRSLEKAIGEVGVSHEININPEVNPESVIKPDGVLRWGVWLLVVTNLLNAAGIGFIIYMSYFHG